MKKNSLYGSDIFNIDSSVSKENFLTQSSFTPQCGLAKRSIDFKKFSMIPKSSLESEKLSYLIETKKNSTFENPSGIICVDQAQDPKMRFYWD